jgi:hypothetical protein
VSQAKGFNVPRVSSLLGLRGELGDLLPVWELSSPHLQESLQEALAEGRDNGEATLELLVRLFLLRTPVDRNRIIAELGQNVWDALVGLRMLHPVRPSTCFPQKRKIDGGSKRVRVERCQATLLPQPSDL